ncbi:MAG: L-threonylcarbamoyladenylate synthase [Candidatus Hodarchaeales archaeon]
MKYKTIIQKIDDSKPLSKQLEKAAELIKNGEIVVFPTETVYGLGANALNTQAVAKIFKAKGRPTDNPLIIHVRDQFMLKDLVKKGKISNLAKNLIKAFWPGPLTLILPKSSKVPSITTGGLKTIAVRMPSNLIALELLKKSECPIAAPSANISGRPSSTILIDLIEDLNGRIPLIIDGGKSEIGLESTVIDLTVSPPMVHRPGKVTIEEIEACINSPVELYAQEKPSNYPFESYPRSPGTKYKHYAPKAEVYILENKEALLKALSETERLNIKAGLIINSITKKWLLDQQINKKMIIKLSSYTLETELASILFSELREMDRSGVQIIFIELESISSHGIGIAIKNRIEKAANSKVFKETSSLSPHNL